MKRREFITLLGGAAAAWPLTAHGQQSKIARIGALYIGLADAESFKQELREGLRELGYVEDQNIVFEFRSAEGKLDRLPELAAELVRLKVDVIVALYVPCALAVKEATRDIPIVVIAADPVETGIVSSLARSGGNITGVSLMSAASNAKNVELFRDMLPSMRRVGIFGNDKDPVFAKAMIDEVQRAAGPTNTEIKPVVMIHGPNDDLESAFMTMVERRRRPRALWRISEASCHSGPMGPPRFGTALSLCRRFCRAGSRKTFPLSSPRSTSWSSTSRPPRLSALPCRRRSSRAPTW